MSYRYTLFFTKIVNIYQKKSSNSLIVPSRAQSRVLSSSSTQHSSRKLISPLIKVIHPDRYHTESKSIQATNVQCLQTINEIWDVIEGLENEIASAISSTSINIKSPLKESYILSCYNRVSSDDETLQNESKLENISITLKIPVALIQRRSLTITQVKQSLNRIFQQVGTLCIIAGVENPFENIKVYPEVNSSSSANTSVNTLLSSEIHTKIFERALQYQRTFQLNNQLFNNRLSQSKGKNKKQNQLNLLSLQVVEYLRMGNVKFRNIDALEDLILLTKLQDFLVEYGPYLSFKLEKWCKIYIIMHGDDRLISNKSALKNTDASSKETKKRQKYSCEKHKDKYIIEIPKDFKNKDLIAFLTDNLSVVNQFDYDSISFS